MLSANKKLIAEKLAEEDLEKKVKGEAKKERHIVMDFSIFVIFVFLIYIFHVCVCVCLIQCLAIFL